MIEETEEEETVPDGGGDNTGEDGVVADMDLPPEDEEDGEG